jgi:hypothetical protein
VIALVISAMFIIIILTYRHFLIIRAEKARNMASPTTETTESTESQLMTRGDAIAIASVISGIVITGILPILISPLLDYTASVQDDSKLMIEIKNLGFAPANNIALSVSAKNVTFSNFESEPFLANHFRTNNTVLGKGLFEINILPPGSYTNVTSKLDSSKADKNEPLKLYLRSDEGVGFHGAIIMVISYLVLLVTYVMLSMYLVYWHVVTGSKSWRPLNRRSISEIINYIIVITMSQILLTSTLFSIYFRYF